MQPNPGAFGFRVAGPTTCPPSEPWEVSVVQLLKSSMDVPVVAAKALGLLDRFGALRLSDEGVGFDNNDVDWAKITSVTCRRLTVVLTESGLEHEADRLRKLLPPLPGRKWVVDRCAQTLGGLARDALDRTVGERAQLSVVSGISYRRSLGRSKEMTAGLAVCAILGLVPSANDCILSTARRHGATVIEA